MMPCPDGEAGRSVEPFPSSPPVALLGPYTVWDACAIGTQSCLCSACVQPLFSRKSLWCNVFSCSATYACMRVFHVPECRRIGSNGREKSLLCATPAEQLNTLHHNDLRLNTRRTHAEHTRRVRARAFFLPFFVRRKERVGEFEGLRVGSTLSSCAIGGLRAVCGLRRGSSSEVGRPSPTPGGVNGSSWGVPRTGHSNPAASVRLGVSMGVVWCR